MQDNIADRNEVEVKYRLDGLADHATLRRRLTELGASPSPVQREQNLLFDNLRRELASRQALLRLRRINGGPHGTLTLKGPASFRDGVNTRSELEVDVGDVAVMQALLEALGYSVTLTYGKERETWRLGGVEVTLDTLDFGVFCEIEGPKEKLLALGQLLGLHDDRIEYAGYAELMARHLSGGAPGRNSGPEHSGREVAGRGPHAGDAGC